MAGSIVVAIPDPAGATEGVAATGIDSVGPDIMK